MGDRPPPGGDPTVTHTDATRVPYAAPERDPRARLAAGAQVDRYEILGLIGAGGMGDVYRARDPELARDVAIKRLRHGGGSLDDARARLRREAQAMARVDHPAVVKIFDVGVDDGQLFVAMELIDGGTLAAWLRARPRSWREITAVFAEVGRGLAAAHGAGLVHRDVKPANILIDASGRAHVGDFGLARAFGDDGGGAALDVRSPDEVLDVDVTATGAVVGTPAYMAPEQHVGGAVDAAADQFSLCVALWEALHGVRPFAAEGAGAAAVASLRARISAAQIEPGERRATPRRLDAIVRRGLLADAARRWPSMDALVAALDRALGRRRRVIAAIAIAAGLAATAAAFVLLRPHRAPAAPAPTLTIGPAQLIDVFRASDAAMIALADGRIARSMGTTIAISSRAGGAGRTLPSPDGGRVLDLQPSSSGAAVIATTLAGDACAYWLVPVDAGAPRALGTDPDCAPAGLAPDGHTLAVIHPDRLVVRDVATGAVRWQRATPVQFAWNLRRPLWSPDGQRLAVDMAGKTFFLDGASGRAVAIIERLSFSAWLDPRTLIASSSHDLETSALELVELGPIPRVEQLGVVDGWVGMLTTDGHGVLVLKKNITSQAFVIGADPATPTAIDAQPRLDTGAVSDFDVIGWTADDQVITYSDHRIVRTPRDGHGTTLVPGPVDLGRVVLDHLVYSASLADHTEIRSRDLRTGTERVIASQPLSTFVLVDSCATTVPSCIIADALGAHWFDPVTGRTGGAIPGVATAELSPDGRELALVAANQIAVRPVAGGPDLMITPVPPLTGDPADVFWSRDGRTLLVRAEDPVHNTYQLVRLDRDGHWKSLATSASRTFSYAVESPDRKSIAVTTRDEAAAWIYLPFTDARSAP